MPTDPKTKPVDSLWTFAIAVAFGGPLALPLLWRNPRFSKRTKLWVSLFVIIMTLGLVGTFGLSLKSLTESYDSLKALEDKTMTP